MRIVQTQANVYLDYIPRYININSTTTRLIDSRRAPFVTSGMAAFYAYFRISWAPELAWLWQATLELGKEECVKRKTLVKRLCHFDSLFQKSVTLKSTLTSHERKQIKPSCLPTDMHISFIW